MIESGEEEEVKNQVQIFLLRDFNRKQKKMWQYLGGVISKGFFFQFTHIRLCLYNDRKDYLSSSEPNRPAN